jgi:hypothetical protein
MATTKQREAAKRNVRGLMREPLDGFHEPRQR